MPHTTKTLYDALADSLARRILDGCWPVGSQIPPEMELALIYKCSRTTIRRALAQLERAGMISRRPKVGTIVTSKGPGVSVLYSLSNLNDIQHLGEDHRRQILVVDTFIADQTFASEFLVSAGSKFLRFSALRLGMQPNDPPIGFSYVYLPPRYHGVIEKAKREPSKLIVSLVEGLTGKTFDKVEQHVCAAPLPESIAMHLDAPAGIPALRIIRRYLEERGSRLLLSENWYPGTRYAFHFTMHPQQSNRSDQ